MAVEREPVTRLTDAQEKLQGQQKELASVQSSLQQLALAASEFGMPSLFETAQAVTSSEPTRVSAATSDGAAIGGYEVEVTQLANSAQRTFTFTSPAAEDTLTIDGNSFTVKAGESAKEFANAVNSDSSSTVYAAVLEGNTLVLSNRATGNTGAEFIKVSDPGATLVEKEGTAKEGKDAEYKVDGVAGTSASNTVTNAIAGVTLSLERVDHHRAGDDRRAAARRQRQRGGSAGAILRQALQLDGRSDPEAADAPSRSQSRQAPPNTAPAPCSATSNWRACSPTCAKACTNRSPGSPPKCPTPATSGSAPARASAGGASQASIEGLLTVNTSKLSEAVKTNPAGVQQMLEKWSQGLQSTLEDVAGPGGTLEARATGDTTQITELTSQITTMNEMLAVREKALQATYAELESAISRNTSQAQWLTSQEASLVAAKA